MANGQVNWYEEEVILELADATTDLLWQLVLRMEAEAKLLIVQHDQVDTGFMLNTVYSRVEERSTYSETAKNGVYSSAKTGQGVPQQKAPEAPVPSEYQGFFGAAAEYAIYQEMLVPFLFPAAVKVANEDGAGVRVKPK